MYLIPGWLLPLFTLSALPAAAGESTNPRDVACDFLGQARQLDITERRQDFDRRYDELTRTMQAFVSNNTRIHFQPRDRVLSNGLSAHFSGGSSLAVCDAEVGCLRVDFASPKPVPAQLAASGRSLIEDFRRSLLQRPQAACGEVLAAGNQAEGDLRDPARKTSPPEAQEQQRPVDGSSRGLTASHRYRLIPVTVNTYNYVPID